MTPQRDNPAGNRGGAPPGDPGSSPQPPSPPRLPNLTSPNPHQRPNPRPAEHPQKPQIAGRNPHQPRPSPPQIPTPVLPTVTADHQPGRAQGQDNKIHRSPVTIGNVTQIRPFQGRL